MNRFVMTIAAASVFAFSGSAMADKASAPGQDRVCLTTASDTTGANTSILSAKWLPRKAADKQLEKGVGHAKGENPAQYGDAWGPADEPFDETCAALNPGGALNPD